MWTAFAIVNDVYLNGQDQDVWCRSNKIIDDLTMYKPGYFLNNLVVETCNYFDIVLKYYYIITNGGCEVNKYIGELNSHEYCLCSN